MHATTAHDDHGRTLTTTADAAEWYREAQRAAVAGDAVAALRRAIAADPAFAVAAADLDALTNGTTAPPPNRRLTTWERHHFEIVVAVAAGKAGRAVSLLREHLSEVGCDPLALRIVGRATPDQLDDLRTAQPPCHS